MTWPTTYVESLTENLLRVVAHLVDLERRTGRRVKLALEPEPSCFLETTEETVRYFQERVWSADGDATASPASPACPPARSSGLVRRHLGVVFDICHQSVGSRTSPHRCGRCSTPACPIFKLQAAAALWVPEVDRRGWSPSWRRSPTPST